MQEAYMSEEYTVSTEHGCKEFLKFAQKLFNEKGFVVFTYSFARKRTKQQQKAIEVYCRLVAEACNDGGLYREIHSKILGRPMEVPWTQDTIKEFIWRPTQLYLWPSKTSTTQLEPSQVSQVYDVIHKHLIERTNGIINITFPDDQKVKQYAGRVFEPN